MSTLKIIGGELGEHVGGVKTLIAVVSIDNSTGEEMPVMFGNSVLVGVDNEIARNVLLSNARRIMIDPSSLPYRFELRTYTAAKSEPIE